MLQRDVGVAELGVRGVKVYALEGQTESAGILTKRYEHSSGTRVEPIAFSILVKRS
jgi:hypothetical protein